MTGSGTQESPYVVSTWEEFLSVCNIDTNTYVEWNNAEVDFNDINPHGFDNPITITSNISLFRVTWKNFTSKAGRAFEIAASATKLNFEEFNFLNGVLFHDSNKSNISGALFCSTRTTTQGSYTMNKCSFSYFEYSAREGSFIKYAIRGNINNSAIHIRSICAGEYKFEFNAPITFTECNINFDIQAGSLYGCLRGFLCWYSGKIQTSDTSWTNRTAYLPGNSVFDVQCNVPITFSSGVMYRCIYNSDKCTLTGPNWVGATTEQLSDTAYLYNQGLPVVVNNP